MWWCSRRKQILAARVGDHWSQYVYSTWSKWGRWNSIPAFKKDGGGGGNLWNLLKTGENMKKPPFLLEGSTCKPCVRIDGAIFVSTNITSLHRWSNSATYSSCFHFKRSHICPQHPGFLLLDMVSFPMVFVEANDVVPSYCKDAKRSAAWLNLVKNRLWSSTKKA